MTKNPIYSDASPGDGGPPEITTLRSKTVGDKLYSLRGGTGGVPRSSVKVSQLTSAGLVVSRASALKPESPLQSGRRARPEPASPS